MYPQNKIPKDSFIWSNIIYNQTPIYLGSLNKSICEISSISSQFISKQKVSNVIISLYKVINKNRSGYTRFKEFIIKSDKALLFPTIHSNEIDSISIQDAYKEQTTVDIYASANISFDGISIRLFGDIFIEESYYKPLVFNGTFSNIKSKSKLVIDLNLEYPTSLLSNTRTSILSNTNKYIFTDNEINKKALNNSDLVLSTNEDIEIEWNFSESRSEFSDINEIEILSNNVFWTSKNLTNLNTNIIIEITEDARWR